MRTERRRHLRERQAAEMNDIEDHSESNLAQVAPVLDEAIGQLEAEDRTAILLRFFERKVFRSVGHALGSSEDAARKRVDRALEKLHVLLKHRGATLSAAALGTALATQAVTAAPAGLALSVTCTVLASSATGGTTFALAKILTMSKIKLSILSAIVVASVATPLVIHHRSQVQLRQKEEPLRQQQPTRQQVRSFAEMMELFTQIKTCPFSLEDFRQAVEKHAGTNSDNLSASERERLFACINRFFACYSSGKYDDFKAFRLRPPFTVSEAVASAVRKAAAQESLNLKSDEDVLHFAWNHYNGTNKIGEVNEEHFLLSIAKRQELQPLDLREPSVGRVPVPGSGISSWEGAVVYQPTPAELLAKEGSLRFFRLEIFVRFSPLVSGPASPLVLTGYWDSARNDWMPDALSTVFHAGSYDTMF
jgi:hypothetical protein